MPSQQRQQLGRAALKIMSQNQSVKPVLSTYKQYHFDEFTRKRQTTTAKNCSTGARGGIIHLSFRCSQLVVSLSFMFVAYFKSPP
jgi:hypothetical protein